MPKLVDIVDHAGQAQSIPEENVGRALAQGWRMPDQTDYDNEQIRQQAGTSTGILATFAGSAANEFALGAPEATVDVAAAHGNRTAQSIKNTADIYQNENPTAATLGKVVGFGGQVLSSLGSNILLDAGELGVKAVRGAIGTQAAKTAMGRIGMKAGSAAATGAAITGLAALPPAVTDAVMGNPGDAVEKYAAHVGLGGLFGIGLGAAEGVTGEFVSKVASKLNPGRIANQKAAEILGLTPVQLSRMSAQRGESIPDTIQFLGRYALDNGLVEFGDNSNAVLSKLGEHMQNVGSSIGAVLTSADQATATGMSASTINVMQGAVDRIAASSGKAVTAAQKETMARTVFEYMAEHPIGDMSAEELGNFKTRLQNTLDTAWDRNITPPPKQALKYLQASISDELENAVKTHLGQDSLDLYQDLKGQYALKKPIVGTAFKAGSLQKQAAREVSATGSLLERIKGAATGVGSVGLASGAYAIGGPLLALPAAVVGLMTTNYVRKRSSASMAAILDGVAGFNFTTPSFSSTKLGASTIAALTARQFPQAAAHLSQAQANPESLANRVPDFQQNNVNVAAQSLIQTAHQFLYSKLPVNPNPSPLNPTAPYQPSSQALAKFNRYYRAVYDPKHALENPSTEGKETLQAVYPNLYNEMLQALSLRYGGQELTYQQRQGLGRFFDMPGMKSLPIYQGTPSLPGGQPKTSGKTPQWSASSQTPTQRVTAR